MAVVSRILTGRVALLRQAARLVGLLGLVATLSLWHLAAGRSRAEADARFGEAALHVRRLVEERMLRALDVVAGFRALFQVADGVSRADFHRHAANLRLAERFPGVVAMQFAPLVLPGDKAGFEAAVRGDTSVDPNGYPDFAVQPAGSRAFYTPVLYNEPMAGNEAAFGYDSSAEPSRRRIMERSRDSGEAIVSQPLDLLQGATGFVVRQAVYRRGTAPWTEEQRRDAYIGQVNGVFRAHDLISPLLRDHLQDYRIRIEDRGASPAPPGLAEAAPQLLFDSQPEAAGRAVQAAAPRDRREGTTGIAGRSWQITLTRSPSWPHLAPLPLAVLLGGAGLTLAALWLLHGLARHYRSTAALAQRLAHQAQHDALTGLPNRLLLQQRLDAALQDARRDAGREGGAGGLSLLFIDLNRFKVINDTLGHATGDLVLQTVALRLRHALRPGETVARLGGDEFVVLLPALPTPGAWRPIADRLLLLIDQPMEHAGQMLSVGASLGAAHYPEDGTDAEALLRHADGMMYGVKQATNRQPLPAA